MCSNFASFFDKLGDRSNDEFELFCEYDRNDNYKLNIGKYEFNKIKCLGDSSQNINDGSSNKLVTDNSRTSKNITKESSPADQQIQKSPNIRHRTEGFYVSLCLDIMFVISYYSDCEKDKYNNERAFRKLDESYCAWLEMMFHRAEEQFSFGKLNKGSFFELRDKFKEVQEIAMKTLDAKQIRLAREGLASGKKYDPPRNLGSIAARR